MLDNPYATETPMPWMCDGAPEVPCASDWPETWFPQKDRLHPQLLAHAKEVCATCPLQAECLEWSIREHVMDGVWGGLAGRERRHLIRERRAA